MADLFLHLPFARRLRFADGLHPLAGEAIGRRPSLVILGASLACLPENERRGMSWFRRLFSGGGEAARWQKLLAPTPGSPHIDVLLSILAPEDAALGPLARFAIGLGVLSHEILEEKIGGLTSSLQGAEKSAVERAQARLWLQSAVPGRLEHEWKPAVELADAEANKRALVHVDRALKRVHGAGPGEAALARWLKGLAVELTPLAEARGPSGALPPPLSVADHDARGPHFESVAFVEKAQAAVGFVVNIANRLGEAFEKNNPDRASLAAAVGKLEEKKPEIEAQRGHWKEWLKTNLETNQNRGRNPKPAYTEGVAVLPEHKLGSLTGVMRLSDLPPEAGATDSGAPPVPEGSDRFPRFPASATGPAGMPPPPTTTQEVSIAQIQAEAAAGGFQAPAHTQEVSIAQIEALESVKEAPDATQEVATSQVVAETASEKNARTTQPISKEELDRANAEDAAAAAQPTDASSSTSAPANPATTPTEPVAPPPPPVSAEGAPVPSVDGAAATQPPPPPASTEPPKSADDAAAHAHTNGSNGVAHREVSEPTEPAPTSPPPQDPPRE